MYVGFGLWVRSFGVLGGFWRGYLKKVEGEIFLLVVSVGFESYFGVGGVFVISWAVWFRVWR